MRFSSGIPKIFHFVWIGPDELCKSDKACIMSWKRHHKDWKFILWSDRPRDYDLFFDKTSEIDHTKLVNKSRYMSARALATKANIVRLEVLFNHGGVYVDTDFFCHKSIDVLIDKLTAFACEQDDEFINNAIVGAECGHDSIRLAIENLESICNNTHHCEEIATGPHLFTEMFREKNRMTILDRLFFYPMSHRGEYEKLDTESYATHLWNFSWRNSLDEKK